MTNINQYGQPVGASLPAWRPVPCPARQTVAGQYCHLAPLSPRHAEDLFQAYSLASDGRDWTWLDAERPATIDDMHAWLMDKIENPGLVPFAVIDRQRDKAVGVVSYLNIDANNGKIEVGHVTWSPLMQKKVTGSEALYLMLKTVFDLGYRRVEWKCDSLNAASRRAAERLGFTWEGRFRQAMVRKQRNRDTDWLSLMDNEWPVIEQALSTWLQADNFTQAGQQIRPFSRVLDPLRHPAREN